jgi:hypothetical protein
MKTVQYLELDEVTKGIREFWARMHPKGEKVLCGRLHPKTLRPCEREHGHLNRSGEWLCGIYSEDGSELLRGWWVEDDDPEMVDLEPEVGHNGFLEEEDLF